jgi:hypothetical protein
MGSLPEQQQQQLKSRQLRERYRLQRRRQALMLLGWAGALVLFAGLATATVLLLRSCDKPAEDGPLITSIPKQAAAGGKDGELAGENSFRLAPWLLAVDDERLYAATDEQKRAAEGVDYPIDHISAYNFGESKPLWEVDLPPESQAGALFAAGGNACMLTTHLADPPYVELRGLAGNDGSSRWSQRINKAERAKATCAGGTIVLNYAQGDTYRLMGYRGADGKRTGLGLKLPLEGLANSEIDQALSQEMQLYSWDAMVGYTYYNVAGVVDAAKGKLVCENALDYYVYDLVYSLEGKHAYALTGGETSDSYVLWELAKDGVPLELYQFLSPSDDILLLAAHEYVALAFTVAEGSTAGRTKLVVLKDDVTAPLVEQVLEQPGVAVDIAHLPGPPEPAQFLLACNGGRDSDDWPTGKAQLYLVEPEGPEPVSLLAELKQPVQYFWTLGDACLVVCRGGQVYSSQVGGVELASVLKLKYELALPYASPSEKTLALASAPRDRWQGKPGKAAVVAVLRQPGPPAAEPPKPKQQKKK